MERARWLLPTSSMARLSRNLLDVPTFRAGEEPNVRIRTEDCSLIIAIIAENISKFSSSRSTCVPVNIKGYAKWQSAIIYHIHTLAINWFLLPTTNDKLCQKFM